MPGDQIQHEVVPGHRRARRDQLLARAGNDQHALGLQRHVGKHLLEGIGVAPVHRRLLAVEQARLRQQEHARARRAQQRALRMHAARPLDKLRIAAGLPALAARAAPTAR